MGRKLLGTALLLLLLGIIVLIARDNLPLGNRVTWKGHHEVPAGGPSEG